MGSRINLSLNSLAGTPEIQVLLGTRFPDPDDLTFSTPSATVTFNLDRDFSKSNSVYDKDSFEFDVCLGNDGIILSCDFNWYRYEEDHPHRRLMRWLFETSVPFTVIH